MKKIYAIILIIFTAQFAFAEIKLGGLFAESGPAGFLGMPEKQTLEMLVEEVNAAGGLNGEQIKLITYDTQGLENRTISFFKRLATKDKVMAVIGPSRTGSTMAIKRLAERYKMPLISCAASRKIVDPVSKYVFKTPQSDIQVAEKLYEYLLANGKKNVAFLTAQSGYGSTGLDALHEIAKKYPVNIVGEEKFRDTDKDMTSQLTKLKNKNPDAIICWGVGPAPAIVARNAKQLGIDNLFMTQGVASQKFIELAGDAANGIKLTAGRLIVADQIEDGNKYKPVLMKYKNDFESKYNTKVSAFGGHAYDAFHFFKLAYEKGIDASKLVQNIENIRGYIGTAGEFNLSAEDHTGLTKDAFVIVEIKDGKFELVK